MKGVPIFAMHEPFDLLYGMVIDLLHAIGGIIKLLLQQSMFRNGCACTMWHVWYKS